MAWRACRGDDGEGLPSGGSGGVVSGDRERRDRVKRGIEREGYPNPIDKLHCIFFCTGINRYTPNSHVS
jgi:hypothetical protein